MLQQQITVLLLFDPSTIFEAMGSLWASDYMRIVAFFFTKTFADFPGSFILNCSFRGKTRLCIVFRFAKFSQILLWFHCVDIAVDISFSRQLPCLEWLALLHHVGVPERLNEHRMVLLQKLTSLLCALQQSC